MADTLHLVPPSSGPTPLAASRGRMLNAEQIIQRWFLGPEGEPQVKSRWVRDNLPGKMVVSETRVFWYESDVAFIVEESRRTGRPLKSVQLPKSA